MRLIRIKIFTAVLLLCCPLGLYAQLDSELRRHVIIAIDQYPTQDSGTNKLDATTATTVIPLLRQYLDSLLTDRDYVSVVHYGIGTQDPSFAKYATCTTPWENFSAFRQRLNSVNWLRIAQNKGRNRGECFSMMTGAKLYSLLSLFRRNEGKQNNKTYLLMITDNQYNGGGDIDAEYVHFEGLDYYRNPNLSRADFFKTCLAVSEKYNFNWLGRKIIIPHTRYPYQLALFEVIPSSSFSLNSIVDYPANLGLQRVRGAYTMKFNYRNISDKYHVKKIEILVKKSDGNYIQKEYTGDDGKVDVMFPINDSEGCMMDVKLRGWLEQKDSIYSGLVLSPYDENFKNLTVTVNLPLPERKKILGFIPLYDWMWWIFPNDADSMVAIWTGVLIFLLCMLVTYILRKIIIAKSTYTPDDHSINIIHT